MKIRFAYFILIAVSAAISASFPIRAAESERNMDAKHNANPLASGFKYNTILLGKLKATSKSLDVCVTAALPIPGQPSQSRAHDPKNASGCSVVPYVAYVFEEVHTLKGPYLFDKSRVNVVPEENASAAAPMEEGECYAILADVPNRSVKMRKFVRLTAPEELSFFRFACPDMP